MSTRIKKLQEIINAQGAFNIFVRQDPFNGYVVGSARSTKTIVAWIASGATKTIEQTAEELRASGEDPEEPYLFAFLGRPLPDGVELPAEFMGLKVSVEVVGTVEAA